MTWGSTTTIGGDGSRACPECTHLAECRAACRNKAAVLCEDGGPGWTSKYQRKLVSVIVEPHVIPGVPFTRQELIQRCAGHGSTVHSYLYRGVKYGNLQVIERRRCRTGVEYVYLLPEPGGMPKR